MPHPISVQLYKKLVNLTRKTKTDLQVKGLAIPSKSDDTVKIGNFFVVKHPDGYHCIHDQSNAVLFDQINLLQTAILIANSLAVGKKPELSIVEHDKRYGYNRFNVQNYSRLAQSFSKKNDWDRYESAVIKKETSKEKAELSKNYIIKSFEKLQHFR